MTALLLLSILSLSEGFSILFLPFLKFSRHTPNPFRKYLRNANNEFKRNITGSVARGLAVYLSAWPASVNVFTVFLQRSISNLRFTGKYSLFSSEFCTLVTSVSDYISLSLLVINMPAFESSNDWLKLTFEKSQQNPNIFI
jgi:hypothetical protein